MYLLQSNQVGSCAFLQNNFNNVNQSSYYKVCTICIEKLDEHLQYTQCLLAHTAKIMPLLQLILCSAIFEYLAVGSSTDLCSAVRNGHSTDLLISDNYKKVN